MAKRPRLTRERLDGTVLDIEFLLVAVIQGLALTTLAVEAEPVMGEAEWVYLPYVAAGFVLVLNFWSLAIIHSISFIVWPFDIVHTLLYLLVAFVEVAGLSQVSHPGRWFVLMFAFFVVSYALYLWDAKMIAERRDEFQDTPARARLWEHVHTRQTWELRAVLPGALVFHGLILLGLWLAPDLILTNGRHVFLVTVQLLIGLAYLADIVRNFRVRQRLIGDCVEDD